MPATPVTVVAHFEDSLGVAQANQLIVFTPSDDLIINGTDGVPAQPVVARLDGTGNLSVQLWASNDPNVQPQGFTYQVNEFPNNPWGDTYSILIVASSSPVQLKSLAPVATSASTTYAYATEADITAAIDALATVASSGLYTDLIGAPTVPTTAAQVGALTQAVADGRYDALGAATAVSTATTTALTLKANASDLTTGLAAKAPLASPAFTGSLTLNGSAISTAPATATTPGTVQLPTGQTSTQLAKPAITGAYADLTGLPTIPPDESAAVATLTTNVTAAQTTATNAGTAAATAQTTATSAGTAAASAGTAAAAAQTTATAAGVAAANRLLITTALMVAAATPDAMANGAITRDANLTPTGYNVLWPDGATGVYAGTASTNANAPGLCDSWVITHIPSGQSTADHTYSQPTVSRDATSGAITNRPAITVS